jgi:hypothetical protein
MPAHWMLARLGKRVMRPGGLETSRRMIEALRIGGDDDVVEMWPALGTTATLALAAQPRSYVGVERGPSEAARARAALPADYGCIVAPTHQTGLPDGCASVVYGEALLTLEPASRKEATVAEARRLLRPAGRYGVHELLLEPDELPEAAKADIERTLTRVLRVGARPLTGSEWRALLEKGQFSDVAVETHPMLLLDPRTVRAEEGVAGTMAILARAARHRGVFSRLVETWRIFNRYRDHLGAIALTATRP